VDHIFIGGVEFYAHHGLYDHDATWRDIHVYFSFEA